MEHAEITATDTICAISTAPGTGGIAVARISGPQAISVAGKIWRGRHPLRDAASHSAHVGDIVDRHGDVLDNCVATVYRAPRSFTGEDVVELSVHGSRYIQQELINTLIQAGCRLAERGEFTRRAFAAGRFDLAEAEGIADIIAASSRASHRLAMKQMRGDLSTRLSELRATLLDLAALLELELDFSEEDVEFASRQRLVSLANEVRHECRRLAESFSTGSAIKEGVPVAITGAPNVGKSTLLNRLVGDDRAIVSDIPGTTRDTIEDTADIDGITFRFIDTAGLRATDDTIEAIGIDRSRRAAVNARIVLYVIDPTAPLPSRAEIPATDGSLIFVINKTDLIDDRAIDELKEKTATELAPEGTPTIAISARSAECIEPLTSALIDASGISDSADDLIITNARHYEALTLAARSAERVIQGLESGISGDLVAQDLRETLHHLGTITGAFTPDDILATVFSRFCIGK